MTVNLKQVVTSTNEVLEEGLELIGEAPGLDLSILADQEGIDGFVAEMQRFVQDILKEILDALDGLVRGVSVIADELHKLRVLQRTLEVVAGTFTGLLEASLDINRSAGSPLIDFQNQEDFARRVQRVTDEVGVLFSSALPDEGSLEQLESTLVVARTKILELSRSLAVP